LRYIQGIFLIYCFDSLILCYAGYYPEGCHITNTSYSVAVSLHITVSYTYITVLYMHITVSYTHITVSYTHITVLYMHITVSYTHITASYIHILLHHIYIYYCIIYTYITVSHIHIIVLYTRITVSYMHITTSYIHITASHIHIVHSLYCIFTLSYIDYIRMNHAWYPGCNRIIILSYVMVVICINFCIQIGVCESTKIYKGTHE